MTPAPSAPTGLSVAVVDGYVGLTSAARLAHLGHDVIGYESPAAIDVGRALRGGLTVHRPGRPTARA